MINGKVYPLWQQFIDGKDEWIGGTLQETDDMFGTVQTAITDITLRPNGAESAFFSIEGENFGCGFDVRYGGISPESVPGVLTFRGPGGLRFQISKKGE